MGHDGARAQAGHGGEIHNAAEPAPDHFVFNCEENVKRAVHIHLKGALPGFPGNLVNRFIHTHAGAVHEEVDGAKGFAGFGSHRLGFLCHGHVTLHHAGLPAVGLHLA